MYFKFFLSLLLLFITSIFSIQNSQVIEINLLFFKLDIPLYVLAVNLIIYGMLISSGFGIFKELKYKRIIKKKNRTILKLRKEIASINSSVYGQDIAKNDNIAYKNIIQLLNMKTDDSVDFSSYIENLSTNCDIQKNDDVFNDDKKQSKQEYLTINNQDSTKLDNLLSGFDDLESDDFSISKKNEKIDDTPWYMKSYDNISSNVEIPKNTKNYSVDLKSTYDKYLLEIQQNHKRNLKKATLSKTQKKYKKIQFSKLKKINSEQTFLKSLLKDETLVKALDDISLSKSDYCFKKNPSNSSLNLDDKKTFDKAIEKNHCSISELYKQNTSPENTLSQNLVKEKFNWKYDINEIKTVDSDYYNGEPKSSVLEKINKLFR